MHQLSLPSRTFGRALPDRLVAGLQASLLAATALLLVLVFTGIVAYDESPWKLLRVIAAVLRGPDVLDDPDEYDLAIVGTGLSLFYVAVTLYGVAISFLVGDSPRRYAMAIGLAYGVALYAAVFHGLSAMYPWLEAYRTWDTLLAHVLYGALLASSYCAFRRE